MNSMPNPEQTDPHDVAVAALRQAREQIGRADKPLPRVDEQVSRSEQGAARKPSGQQKRLAVPDRRPSRGRLALLGLIGLLLAACISVAALAWQSPYGDAAKLIIARWAPQRVSTSSLPLEKQELPAQPSPPTVDVAATAALPQPAPLAQTPPRDVAPTAVPLSPELAQWLQTMARDLANVEQGIEQLKTSQEQMVRDNAELAEQLKAAQAQMARDNANAAGQLKASQEQIARLIAKASEQNLRPKTSAPPPRPITTPARKPVPKLSSPQARARPLAPIPPEQE
jgi:hypothetical protein